ncbi:sodium/potassium/calcium exchanger 3-like isoform X2 [Ruditapes philippinarum]|uniref:sodium/potassium/calcium exchanger 3-like isoform X2 n=1 Tax=Ruditapes philippinarum TaxID=129788 RepID=UPI00295AC384|nr:sodium/potassium/calcium exchanger 3-like isoform X2 [Ruditapes philippinarum]
MAGNKFTSKCRKKFEIRRYIFVALFLVYVGVTCASLILKSDYLRRISEHGKEDFKSNKLTGSLHRLKRDTLNQNLTFKEDNDAEEDEPNCTKRAIEEFPDNFFTLKQTKDGGIAAHIAISLYMFGALAIVCDDYFVSSLEVICERLQLQEDVAGATFMAAGSSAPEFFTSVIGVFIAKNDVGVGTIVGSAVFNILFIIGTCSIFAGMVVKLTWYPMTRDCLFYLLSIAALVIVIDDEKVYWYEATIFLVLYIIYITIMYFNRILEEKSIGCMKRILHKFRGGDAMSRHPEVESDEKQPLSGNVPEVQTSIRINPGENSQSGNYTEEKTNIAADTVSDDKETTFTTEESEGNPHVHVDDKTIDSPWDIPDHPVGKIYWAVMLPMKCLMFVTIPDCRRHGIWRRLYMLTFALSIAWIAACSYLMVWMVTIIGDVLEIPDTVMGLTILAAGTSVPDCLSSVFVARDGYGDMAVSNSIGSNVFDILICLGLPWLLNTAIVENGAPLKISSGGIAYSALILLSTVVFMLVAINLAKWKLNKPFGCLCMFAYVIVIALSCLFELNVFGDFVDPTCPRSE